MEGVLIMLGAGVTLIALFEILRHVFKGGRRRSTSYGVGDASSYIHGSTYSGGDSGSSGHSGGDSGSGGGDCGSGGDFGGGGGGDFGGGGGDCGGSSS